MPILTLDISALLNQNASPQSIQRSRAYLEDDSVGKLIQRGDELEADVIGTAPRPYRVWVQFDNTDIANATCTCPYGDTYEGWCKHIVAVLLSYAEKPDEVEIRSPLVEKLTALDRNQLQTLLLEMADRIPRMVDIIEAALPIVSLLPANGSDSSIHSIATVDALSIRQSVRSAIASSNEWDDDHYDEECYGVAIDEILEIAGQAEIYLERGDYQTGLTILDAVTDELCKHWQILDENGEQTDYFFDETLPLWMEALLDPDLTTKDRKHWAKKLAAWSDEVSSFSDDLTALESITRIGWDNQELKDILQGKISESESDRDDVQIDGSHFHAQEEILARLRILKRTGQHESYLNLAKAKQQYKLHALYLLELDRSQEATTIGLNQPLSLEDSLELAKALYEYGEKDAGLQVAEHRLQQPDSMGMNEKKDRRSTPYIIAELGEYNPASSSKCELASWLCNRATERGEIQRALAAGIIAFENSPNISTYLRVENLAGENWSEQRQKLLKFLGKNIPFFAESYIDIFLHENLIDDAIKALETGFSSDNDLSRVIDTAIELKQRPQWVIEKSCEKAESIMDQGRAACYDTAIDWLKKTKRAYQVLNQNKKWQVYLDHLCEKHYRKYKLRPMLERL